MPPQPSSSCCRAVRRSVTTPRDSIWVSDSQLATAFERFCRVSHHSRRSVSSVPGPLECRRRLGKRRIADLQSLQLHPSLPAWALPTLPDLSQWMWQPPTNITTRSRTQDIKPNAWWWPELQLPNWLSRWFAQDPHAQVLEEAEVADDDRASDSIPAEYALLLKETEDLRAVMALSTVEEADRRYRAFCVHIYQRIASASLTKETIEANFNAVCYLLEQNERNKTAESQLDPKHLVSAVVRGIASCKLPIGKEFSFTFRRRMFRPLLSLTEEDELMQLFALIVQVMRPNMPMGRVEQISTNGTLPVLDKLLSIWNRNMLMQWNAQAFSKTIKEAANLSQQVESWTTVASQSLADGRELGRAAAAIERATGLISEINRVLHDAHGLLYPLPQKSPAWLAEVLDGLSRTHLDRLLYQGTGLIDSWLDPTRNDLEYLEFAWLATVFRLKNVEQHRRLGIMRQMYGSADSSQSLSDAAICELILLHWEHSSKNVARVRQMFHGATRIDKQTCLASLCFTVERLRREAKLSDKEARWFYKTLWEFLRQLGRVEDLFTSLEALADKRVLFYEIFQGLAVASEDLGMAIKLREAYYNLVRMATSPHWALSIWEPFARQGQMDSLTPRQLIQILDVQLYQPPKRIYRREDRVYDPQHRRYLDRVVERSKFPNWRMGPLTASLVKRLAIRCAFERQLTQRQRLRLVECCLRLLSVHQYALTPQVHKALFQVITEELYAGQPGRMARFRWFVTLVQGQYGDDFALKSGLALKEWRDTVIKQLPQPGHSFL